MLIRRTASLTALLSFIALVFSGFYTYLAPRGPGSSQWSALGLKKHDWTALHTNLGILFLVACVVHIVLNIQPIIAYMKNKFGHFRLFTANFNIALILTIWVILSSLLNWPPFSAVRNYKESLGNRDRHHHVEETVKETAELPSNPPMFYSRKSLTSICEDYDLELDNILKELKVIGIDAKAEWTIKEIAKENDMETRSVYDAVYQVK